MLYKNNQTFYNRRQQNWSRNQNTVAYRSNVKLGPVTHTVLIALMVAVLGLIYLTQATRATSYDYAIEKINSQIAELNSEKSDLEIENARLASLNTVKSSSVASTMTTASSTEYTQD